MSTVIAFPVVRRKPAGRSSAEAARSRNAEEPVVVILPVVRIERHESVEAMENAIFETVPGTRRVR